MLTYPFTQVQIRDQVREFIKKDQVRYWILDTVIKVGFVVTLATLGNTFT